MEVEITEMAWKECKQKRLTDREIYVAELVARGLANRKIANELKITPQTVKRHVQNVSTKLDIRNDDRVRRLVIVERLRRMGLGNNSL